MPNLYVNQPTPNRKEKPVSKMQAEKQRQIAENRDRLQRMEYENRQNRINLIRPKEDICLLNIKYKELENSRGARPNLKQNVRHHV